MTGTACSCSPTDDLRRRAVKVMRLDEEQVIVGEGLEDGDAVALTRLELMFDGMPVSAIDG